MTARSAPSAAALSALSRILAAELSVTWTAIVSRPFAAQHPGQEAGHCIRHRQSRDLAAGLDPYLAALDGVIDARSGDVDYPHTRTSHLQPRYSSIQNIRPAAPNEAEVLS